MPTEAPIYLKAGRFLLDVAHGRSPLSGFVPVALFALDAVLCVLIIWRIPYTEIDWVAYMEQVRDIVAGERDYTQIEGGTGPLVYPAAHVYTYTALYHLTDEGRNLLLAQQLFACFYLAALGLAMACYWRAGAPPYVFPLLVLSKRLHSIYMLRCFNDGLAALFLWLALFLFQRRQWTLGVLAYSWGLGIKMSLLLGLPAVGVLLFYAVGFSGALGQALRIAVVQVCLGQAFIRENPRGYFGRAFELSRQFFFRWTVNWRFVGEDVFLSRGFAAALLAVHVALLVLFAVTRWLRPVLGNVKEGSAAAALVRLAGPMLLLRSPLSAREEAAVRAAVTPRLVLTTVLTANVVGLLTARSLHYQFYAYLAWATPYLLWRSRVHPAAQYVLWALQEWAWNVYPSTPASSAVVVAAMAVTVALVWRGATDEFVPVLPLAKAEEAKQ